MKIALAAIILLLLAVSLRADVAFPTETTVYFEKDGQHYDKPVDFTIKCYGYRQDCCPPSDPVDKTSRELISVKGNCETYGCTIHDAFYTNYMVIRQCDLEGTAEGKAFKISNYADYPIKDCDDSGGTRKCTLTFTIPDGTTPSTNPTSTPTTSPTTKPTATPATQPDFISQIVCFIRSIFGMGC